MKLEGYTPSMRESLERVVASRPARLHETWPMMSPADKQEILRKYHPDFIPEGMRELRVGPNKGTRRTSWPTCWRGTAGCAAWSWTCSRSITTPTC
jgi:hypothetical protein